MISIVNFDTELQAQITEYLSSHDYGNMGEVEKLSFYKRRRLMKFTVYGLQFTDSNETKFTV